MMLLAYRPFLDPIEVFTGWGWLLMLPPLIFSCALVYHTLRTQEQLLFKPLFLKAGGLALKVGAVFLVLIFLLEWLG